jgi:hypothetical protein
MYAVILYGSGNLRQPSIASTFQCLETIVDTLRKVDPSDVSRGTLHSLHSNVLHVMASIRYSSWWSAKSKEIMLSYLDQGQRHLQEITGIDAKNDGYSHSLKQCISALINAVGWWRSLISAYSIALMLQAHIQTLYYADYMA